MDMAARKRMMNDSVEVCVSVCMCVCATARMFTLWCMKVRKYSSVCVWACGHACVCVSAHDGFTGGACGQWFLRQTR